MNFDFYDIFSKVIPGGLIVCVLVYCGWVIPTKEFPDLIYLFSSYFVGYLVDAIGFEVQERILRKNSFNQIPNVFEHYEHIDKIKAKYGLANWNDKETDKIFIAIFHTANSIDKRIKSFQDHWVGARNLFIAFLLVLPIMFMEIQELKIQSPKWMGIVVLIVGIQLLLFIRARSRQKLLFTQVLNSYLFTKEKKEKEED